jgi:hypothetical protein
MSDVPEEKRGEILTKYHWDSTAKDKKQYEILLFSQPIP